MGHKKVSSNYKKEFQAEDCYGDTNGKERVAYVDDNVEALKYRLKMISEAKKEVILSTFDFNADSSGKDVMCSLLEAAERGVKVEALKYRLKMISEAKKEVILSTFDFNADSSGKDVMCSLLEAAERGVKVKVIVDGGNGFIDMKMKSSQWFQALASHENVEVQIYNPVNFLKPWKLQARLHDKYVIVDNKMYLLGGRNTTNLFLGDYSESQNLDRELFVYKEDEKIQGSIDQLKKYFESIWNLKDSKPYECKKQTEEIEQCMTDLKKRSPKLRELYPDAYEEWNWQELTVDTNKVTLLQNPIKAENKEPLMWHSVTELMKTGENITVYTPYIICGKEMYEDLTQICEETETVEILPMMFPVGRTHGDAQIILIRKRKSGQPVYRFISLCESTPVIQRRF